MTAEASPQQQARDLGPQLTEAASLIKAGQNREAADLLKRLSILTPAPDPRADYLLGVAAFRSGDLRTAAGAFRRCLAANPLNEAAQYGLAKTLQAQGSHQGAQGAGADSPAESLADILDRSSSVRPGPDELAGKIIWQGRPALRSIAAPVIGPFLLLVAPLVIRGAAETLPAGAARDAATRLWHFTMSAALLLAIVLVATSVVNWLMRELTVFERRIDVRTGLFGHRHVMVWLHDLERPLVIKQPLWQLLLNLGTLEITSTILPAPRHRRAATRMGQLRFSGLPVKEAEMIAETIWSRSLWERRRLVKNFVSSR